MDVATIPDWKRVIALVDLDCFYCQCEHKRLGIPMTEPLAVNQWGALIAMNYAARAMGLSRKDNAASAKKKIPTIHLPHVQVILSDGSKLDGVHTPEMRAKSKVTLARYRDESYKVLSIYQRFCPLVERASIDEAYLDLTAQVDKLCAAYIAQPNEQKDWNWRSLVLGSQGSFTPTTETDIRLFFGCQIVADVRAAVFNELGYTCSGGVAHNRKFSKLIAFKNKPNGQSVLTPRALPDVLTTIPWGKIQGFGGKLGDEVEAFAGPDVKTPQQLTAKFGLAQLSAKFGAECGMWMWRVLHACDDEPVKTVEKIKSFAASKNLPATTTTLDLPQHITVVCVELLARIKNDYAQFHRIPLLFGVHYRARTGNDTKFTSHSKSVSMPKIVHSESASTDHCLQAMTTAAKLLLPKEATACYVNIGVGASNFVEAPKLKQSITRFFGSAATAPAASATSAAAGGGGGGGAGGVSSSSSFAAAAASTASSSSSSSSSSSKSFPSPFKPPQSSFFAGHKSQSKPASAAPAPAAAAATPVKLVAPTVLQAPNGKPMSAGGALVSFAHHHKKHKKYSAATADPKVAVMDKFVVAGPTTSSAAAAVPAVPALASASSALSSSGSAAPTAVTSAKRKADSELCDASDDAGGGGGDGDDSFSAALDADAKTMDSSLEFGAGDDDAATNVDAFFGVTKPLPSTAATSSTAASAAAAAGGAALVPSATSGRDQAIEVFDSTPPAPAPVAAAAPIPRFHSSAKPASTAAAALPPHTTTATAPGGVPTAVDGAPSAIAAAATDFVCKTCRKSIPIVDRTEHADFHLAEKLNSQWRSDGSIPVGSSDLQAALAARHKKVAAAAAAAAQSKKSRGSKPKSATAAAAASAGTAASANISFHHTTGAAPAKALNSYFIKK